MVSRVSSPAITILLDLSDGLLEIERLVGYDAVCVAVSRSVYNAGISNLTRNLVGAIIEIDGRNGAENQRLSGSFI